MPTTPVYNTLTKGTLPTTPVYSTLTKGTLPTTPALYLSLLLGVSSVVQLWFVTTTGLVFLVLFLALSPYRDEAAGRIQIVALVQLEFTYVTAALFFDRQPEVPQG